VKGEEAGRRRQRGMPTATLSFIDAFFKPSCARHQVRNANQRTGSSVTSVSCRFLFARRHAEKQTSVCAVRPCGCTRRKPGAVRSSPSSSGGRRHREIPQMLGSTGIRMGCVWWQ